MLNLIKKLKNRYYPTRSTSLIRYDLERLQLLHICDSGIFQDGIPYVKLANGLVFFGFLPSSSQLKLYEKLDRKTKRKITGPAFGVAMDIVQRYLRENMADPHPPKSVQIFSGDVVLDIGAYVGYFVLKASRIVGEHGLVIAIEPSSEPYAILDRNVKENGSKNVITVPKATYSEKKIIKFYQKRKQVNSIYKNLYDTLNKTVMEFGSFAEIQADTVDNILRDYNISNVDHVFMEINGGEVETLKGMRNVLVNSSSVNVRIASRYSDVKTNPKAQIVSILEDYNFTHIVDWLPFVYASK